MKAKSIFLKHTSLLEDHLLNYLKSGYKPTLAIVFCSPKQPFEDMIRLFDSYNIDLFGCTTAGEITDDSIAQGAVSCLFLDIPKKYYSIQFERNTEGVFNTAKRIRLLIDNAFDNPAVLICSSGILNDGEQIVAGLKYGAEREIPMYGGMAGDDCMTENSYIFSRRDITNNGIAALVFDGDYVELKGLATSGWEAIGEFNTVTKAEDNVIYAINNEPALDFFYRFMDDADKVSTSSLISAQYPFQVVKENECEVLRMAIKIDTTNKSLRLVGSIKEGTKFRFSISPSIDVINKTIGEFETLKQTSPDADAMILFSCVGRQMAFGPFLEDEVKGIYDVWQKPLVGFLSYGEIGNLYNGICEFHNETCSLVVIKQKQLIQ